VERREFITLLGGATAWPLAARAQQGAMPVVGFVYPGTPELSTGVVAAFRKGVGEAGSVEGRNVAVELRFGYGDNGRLPELMADLAHRRVAVIVSTLDICSLAVLRIFASAVPAHLGTPLTIGPADRSLSKSGDAETVAQKIPPDVGAYVRCADREVRSVALVFLF
jgi:putative ABC transport system substrate-binding protein